MAITRKETGEAAHLKIEGDLTIYEVHGLREELSACLADAPAMKIDLVGVTGCDTAGLQLLYAARRSAENNHIPFQIVGRPQTVMETVAGVGLDPEGLFADTDGESLD